MRQLRPYFLCLCLLAGCANVPDSYVPPIQRKPLTGAEPSPIGFLVNMGDAEADTYIVRDVKPSGPDAASWRWTGKRPELRFFLDSVENRRFQVDFSIAESTLKDTGPVTISFFINGNLLDAVKYPEAGEKHFDKSVPAKFLRPNAENIAALEIDKAWVSKTDGAVLGFILTRAGFAK